MKTGVVGIIIKDGRKPGAITAGQVREHFQVPPIPPG
jgi:hypothetical protein